MNMVCSTKLKAINLILKLNKNKTCITYIFAYRLNTHNTVETVRFGRGTDM